MWMEYIIGIEIRDRLPMYHRRTPLSQRKPFASRNTLLGNWYTMVDNSRPTMAKHTDVRYDHRCRCYWCHIQKGIDGTGTASAMFVSNNVTNFNDIKLMLYFGGPCASDQTGLSRGLLIHFYILVIIMSILR